MSSPLGMARAECANLCKDGSCLGIPVECLVSERDGKKVKPVAAPLDRCKLAESKGTCRYFEKAVLPLVHYWPRYAKAVERYRKRLPKNKALPAAIAGMWECDCGNPMQKGRRMCDSCRDAKKRKRWKKAKRRKRA